MDSETCLADLAVTGCSFYCYYHASVVETKEPTTVDANLLAVATVDAKVAETFVTN